jgi:hypothetical protein
VDHEDLTDAYGFQDRPYWDSDSENVLDLDRVYLRERVSYDAKPAEGFKHPIVPAPPQVIDGELGNGQGPPDRHWYPHAWVIAPVTQDTIRYTGEQKFEFICYRCTSQWTTIKGYDIERKISWNFAEGKGTITTSVGERSSTPQSIPWSE